MFASWSQGEGRGRPQHGNHSCQLLTALGHSVKRPIVTGAGSTCSEDNPGTEGHALRGHLRLVNTALIQKRLREPGPPNKGCLGDDDLWCSALSLSRGIPLTSQNLTEAPSPQSFSGLKSPLNKCHLTIQESQMRKNISVIHKFFLYHLRETVVIAIHHNCLTVVFLSIPTCQK